MKFVSWNVNGLRACEGKAAIEREESKAAFDSSEREQARPKVKGFSEVFRSLDADFFCLQETKMQAGQLDLQFEGYESYWNYADKKGYSGTAIFTRLHPLNVTYGMGIDVHDHEGRVVTLEMPDFFLVCCYTPNSQDGLKRLDYRMTWENDFRAYLQRLDTQKPVILCGDLNVAHEEIGHIVFRRVRRTPVGVSIISSSPIVSVPISPTPSSTPTSKAPTTALSAFLSFSSFSRSE